MEVVFAASSSSSLKAWMSNTARQLLKPRGCAIAVFLDTRVQSSLDDGVGLAITTLVVNHGVEVELGRVTAVSTISKSFQWPA